MITYSTGELKPKLKEMWKLCFGDNDEFIQFYFDKIYRNDNTLVLLLENGFPAASLQILPYQIKISNSIYDAGYISGAMTHPEHRNKGYMKQLLNTAFEEMKKQAFTFSFLIPQEDWLFDFYIQYGYEKAFPQSIQMIHPEENIIDYSSIEIYRDFKNFPVCEIYHLYSAFLNQKENVVLKTQDQLKLIVEDLFIEGGYFFYIKQKGLAFVVRNGNNAVVKEIFYNEHELQQILLATIQHTLQSHKIMIWNNDSIDGISRFYGMIKVLDTSKFTQAIPKDFYMSILPGY